MEKLPCYSVSLIFFPISHPHRLALPSSVLSHRRSARACVCECIGKAKRNIFSALHSCLQAVHSPTPGARREKSFRPLWWCARVENVGRAIEDKAGKFVSANLEVGATRSVSLVRIAHPPVKGLFSISLLLRLPVFGGCLEEDEKERPRVRTNEQKKQENSFLHPF